MDRRKFDAIVLANAIAYASPSFGGDKHYFNQKKQTWNNFINSLTWKSATSKEDQINKAKEGFLRVFGAVGAPIKEEKGDKN
jgi:hypothetical protein